MNGKFDPKAISKMMMQGYVAKARPLDEVTHVNGKVALVTGGTSGLGFCTALRLLQGGAKVVAASWSEEEAATALPLFGQAGFGEDSVRFFKCDVTSEESVDAAVAFTAETFGSLDILVTSAGVWSYAHIYDMPEEEFLRVINVNLNGTFRCAKHASKYMIEHGIEGKMVFVSSDCYTIPFPVFGGYAHYAASKGGIVALTTEVAKELKRYGIMVNTVAPGPMSTPGGIYNQVARSLPDEKKAAFGAEMQVNQVDRNPDTDAVALAVYMMCTNLADGITGDCVLADKGMTHNCLYRQPAIQEFPPKAE